MKPNIIVFMTDHQRGDTILNDSRVLTPNVDRLRPQAVTFSRAYTSAPHCCPARASFFSGLYPSEHGIWNNVNVSNALAFDLFDDVRLFPEDLAEAGYRLYYAGKWHVSSVRGPQEYGFELVHHGVKYAPHPNVPDTREWWNYSETKQSDTGDEERTEGRILRPGYPAYTQYGLNEEPFGDIHVIEAAAEKLSSMDPAEQAEQPFFLFVGPLGPHDPYNVPQKFLDLYDPDEIELPESFDDPMDDKPALYRRTKERYSQLTPEEHRESIRHFYAFCSYEDYLFGKILDAVEERGLMDNTLILYCSDHGDYIGSHGLWAKGLPCFREAYHICAMAGGGVIRNPGRVEEAFVSITDWAPTFLELAGVPAERKMAGRSLFPFLEDRKPDEWRTECYTQTNGNEVYGIQRSVSDGEWKYVFNAFDYDELYHLTDDPHEMHNLLAGLRDRDIPGSPYGVVVKELWRKLWSFAKENRDSIVNPYIMTAFAPYGPGILYEKSPQD